MTILFDKNEWEIFKKSQSVNGTVYGGEPLRYPVIAAATTWQNGTYSYIKYDFGYEELLIALRKKNHRNPKNTIEKDKE